MNIPLTTLICASLVGASATDLFPQSSKPRVASGVVESEDGIPLSGAAIEAIGADVGAVSDLRGEFSFVLHADGATLLTASRAGYRSDTLSFGAEDDTLRATFRLAPLEVRLSEVVVSANKYAADLAEVPVSVVVIDADDIRAASGTHVGEALELAPGTRVVSSGVGAKTGVSVRSLNGGPSSVKTLALLDGVPLDVAWDGGVDWRALPVEIVERVETAPGPASALYGSGASAGVVNVVTRRPSESFAALSIEREQTAAKDRRPEDDGYGAPDFSRQRASLVAAFPGAVSQLAAFSYADATERFPTNYKNDRRTGSFFYRADASIEGIDLAGRALFFGDRLADRADRFPNEETQTFLSLDLEARAIDDRRSLTARLFFNNASDWVEPLDGGGETGFGSRRIGVAFDALLLDLYADIDLALGADARFDRANAEYDRALVGLTSRGLEPVALLNNRTGALDTAIAQTFDARLAVGENAFDRSGAGAYARLERSFGERLSVALAARADYFSETGSVLTPEVGAAFRAFETDDYAAVLKARFAEGFRAPSITDLYSRSPNGYGDPTLDPERTRSFEVALSQRFADVAALDVAFFATDVERLIVNDGAGLAGAGYYAFVPTDAGADTVSLRLRRNLGDYSPRGVETMLRFAPSPDFEARLTHAWLDPRDYTFQTAAHRFRADARGRVSAGFAKFTIGATIDRTGNGYFFDNRESPFDAFTLVHARVVARFLDRFTLALEARNLFDRPYRLWHYAPMPGRSLASRVTVEW
jgi:outer membrane cobalamin receptor